jgi:hypothetical protein
LVCVGFNNCEREFHGIILQKKDYEYNGGCPHGPGINEYVRVFIDFSDDGDFVDQFEDLGVAKVHLFDIGDNCKEKLPISHAFSLKVCLPAYLWKKLACHCFHVRAIHQTGSEPPNLPDFTPMFGTIIDRTIRIQP